MYKKIEPHLHFAHRPPSESEHASPVTASLSILIPPADCVGIRGAQQFTGFAAGHSSPHL